MTQSYQIGVLAGCYTILFILCFWVWKMNSENLASVKVLNGNWTLLHIRHAGGTVIMAVLPVFLLSDVPEDLFMWPVPVDFIQALTLMLTGSILLALVAKNPDSLSFEKPVLQKCPIFHVILHFLLRSLFLASYEWFFRGCILFACLYYFGVTTAIFINLVLYTLIHSFNGRKEMCGSVPFGLILCAFTLWCQSVWPAILLHLLLSLSHETLLLMPFLNKKSKSVL